jgi:hypothetical protein
MTAIALATPQPLLACAVCFGDPNSPMAIGASWGVLLLIGVTAAVLSAFAGFFSLLGETIADGARSARRSVRIVPGG